MQNDPSLHHDQQNQSDYFIQEQGAEKGAEFANDAEENGMEGGAETAGQTEPKDFEPFNLDALDNMNKGEE